MDDERLAFVGNDIESGNTLEVDGTCRFNEMLGIGDFGCAVVGDRSAVGQHQRILDVLLIQGHRDSGTHRLHDEEPEEKGDD